MRAASLLIQIKWQRKKQLKKESPPAAAAGLVAWVQ